MQLLTKLAGIGGSADAITRLLREFSLPGAGVSSAGVSSAGFRALWVNQADFWLSLLKCLILGASSERCLHMSVKIDALRRYPVKGLSGQVLESVQLERGQGFPCDRKFGFARPGSGFDCNNPKPLAKTKFYMLARDSALAVLSSEFDDKTGTLSLSAADSNGEFDITTTEGKQTASLFLKSYLSLPADETPTLYEASPHRFTDVSVVSTEMMNAVSIINLDSVIEFSKDIGQHVDPRRFRGNIHLSGLTPFTELEMVDRTIAIGTVQLRVVSRTKRCPATEVDLTTGERDLKTPKLLLKKYGHMDMGVYAEVMQGGLIAEGDEVKFI